MLVLVALLAGPGGQVLDARLEARALEGPGGFEVNLEYRISAPPDAGAIAFHALEIGGVGIDRLSARNGDRPLATELHRSSGPRVSGEVELPGGGGEELTLSLRYRVSGPSLAIPVLVLDLHPGLARPGFFTARVVSPETLGRDFGFPTNRARADDGSYRWELPLVPAFVSLGEVAGVAASDFPISNAGFSFWGLFAVFGAVVVSYLVWMRRVER